MLMLDRKAAQDSRRLQMKDYIRLTAAISLLGASIAVAQTPTPATAPAKPKQYYGTFNSVSGNKVAMTMRDNSTGNWTVASDAPIIFAKETEQLANIQSGDRGYVWVSEDGVIHKIQMVAMKTPMGKKAGAVAKTPIKGTSRAMWGELSENKKDRWWRGEIVNVNEKGQEIEIKRVDGQSGTTHFKADAGTKIYQGGKPPTKVSFGELKVGQTVEAVASSGKTMEITIVNAK
jgi:hypothetical protein